mgnify:CR=1 FL=1|tara:strand:+ start:394 stop:594 length:201 start_codon:yes stop_codon:yes gene_type:complete
MNSRSIIIAILIFIKIIGIASRARAESFYIADCAANYSIKKISYKFWKLTYRCGKSPLIIMGGLRG